MTGGVGSIRLCMQVFVSWRRGEGESLYHPCQVLPILLSRQDIPIITNCEILKDILTLQLEDTANPTRHRVVIIILEVKAQLLIHCSKAKTQMNVMARTRFQCYISSSFAFHFVSDYFSKREEMCIN